ncbi:hypothetical protein G6F63_014364 [Rhizopus arrhizus]|nr:hypothetical protein G6F63_014364 [Rhizopus arrhizus]
MTTDKHSTYERSEQTRREQQREALTVESHRMELSHGSKSTRRAMLNHSSDRDTFTIEGNTEINTKRLEVAVGALRTAHFGGLHLLLMGVGDRDEEDKAAVPTKGPKGRPSETRAPGPGGPEGDTDNTEVVVAEAAERSRAGNVLT